MNIPNQGSLNKICYLLVKVKIIFQKNVDSPILYNFFSFLLIQIIEKFKIKLWILLSFPPYKDNEIIHDIIF